jgi:Tetratricopeptide repeat
MASGRNGFAEAGIPLPAFDLALALTWEATRGEQPFPALIRPWLKRTIAIARGGVNEGANRITDWFKSESATELLGDAIAEIPGVGFLVKHLGNWIIDKTKRTYLYQTRDSLKALFRQGELKKPYELSALLPWMLAEDLKYYLLAHPTERFALFVDEYERVFDEGGAGARWRENPFDNHMRKLIHNTNGLLAIFFSRERLPWEADPEWRDDLSGAQHLLGGLVEEDADQFLRAIPIDTATVRQAIIDSAGENSGPGAAVYPLMLDLQVEHWRSISARKQPITRDQFEVAAVSFEGRRRELVTRVLRDYSDALQTTIERLSVARRFDRVAFECVVKTFGTSLPIDSFDRIANLSFVTRTADGFLSVHNVIARAIRETLDRERRQSSIEVLFEHFAARANVTSPREVTDATVGALFEAAFLRREKGINGYAEWLNEASRAVIEAARYSSAILLWREALQAVETLQPEHFDIAISICLNNLGMLLHAQGNFADARRLHDRALAITERVLAGC